MTNLPLLQTDVPDERYHRTIIATMVNELIKVRPPHDRTAAEIAAGVTPVDFGYPPFDLRRYGLSESASGETNRLAIEDGRDVARESGGAVLVAPSGDFTVDATVTMDVDNTVIDGSTIGATIWRFNPGSADVLFHFTNGASSIVRSGIRNCRFFSDNSTTKTAIKIDDGRQCVIERVGINLDAWQGSGSIGLHTSGRDFFTFRNCDIECARPWLISDGPNLSGVNEITLDMTKVTQVQFNTTESTGKCVEIETGAIIYSSEFDTCDFAGGKYGLFWDETTSARDSLHLGFRNCRFEQSADAAGFDIYIASTANNLANLHLEKVNSSGARGFLYARNLERISLFNCLLSGGSGITNFDVTFISTTTLELVATLVQASSTNTLTSAVLVRGVHFATSVSALSPTALYRYDEGSVISQKPALGYNSVKKWSYQVSLADDAILSLPISDANSVTLATVKVNAIGATQHEGGEVTFSQLGIKQLSGTTNFAISNTDTNLCVYDGATDDLVVRNRLGETAVILVDATWTTL